MPTFAISAEDAALLADYLLFGDVAWDDRVREAAPAEVPLLDRPVTFDEVYDEVIGRVCIHCHMNPEANGGEGGPGNTGGLGFEGSGLDLESWEGLLRGVRRDGEWRSILESPAPGEPPLLLASVLRRRTEAARDLRLPYADAPDATEAVGPDLNALGMPLGLPPLSDEHVSLVKTWLAQGAPGPTSDWASTTR